MSVQPRHFRRSKVAAELRVCLLATQEHVAVAVARPAQQS